MSSRFVDNKDGTFHIERDPFHIPPSDVIYREIEDEVKCARVKFPGRTLMMTALTEEVGELAKALMDEPWANVRKEAIQVACMAIRVLQDGDSSVDLLRANRGLDNPTAETKVSPGVQR